MVSLTIDTEFPDHPSSDPLRTLDQLLGLLSDRSIAATFFIAGAWAQAHPRQVHAIKTAGHHIGNHSYSHCALPRLSEAGIVEDLTACGEVLALYGVEPRPWFRAPYGELDHATVDVPAAIGRAGYHHVPWDADGDDWRPDRSAPDIASSILTDVRARWPRPAIVLLHSWPDHAPRAMELVLDAVEPEGATFLTVDQVGWAG